MLRQPWIGARLRLRPSESGSSIPRRPPPPRGNRPARIRMSACAIASSPEAHSRFTVTPGISTGSCARSAAKRAIFHPCSPSGCAHPRITSSISALTQPGNPVQSRGQRKCGKVVGASGGECALGRAAHRRAHRADKNGFRHCNSSFLIPFHRQTAQSSQAQSVIHSNSMLLALSRHVQQRPCILRIKVVDGLEVDDRVRQAHRDPSAAADVPCPICASRTCSGDAGSMPQLNPSTPLGP